MILSKLSTYCTLMKYEPQTTVAVLSLETEYQQICMCSLKLQFVKIKIHKFVMLFSWDDKKISFGSAYIV